MADTKNLKHLEGKGEMDYDFAEDILFFKIEDREYNFSVEFQNMVIDIDSEMFVVGIQIFNASEFLGIPKVQLRQIPKWNFKTKIEENVIELRLNYQIEVRNKIIEKNPIIIQENKSGLPSPQTVVSH